MKDDQASVTAYTVLQGLLFRAAQPHYTTLLPEPTQQACRRVLNGSDEGRKRLAQLQSPLYRSLFRLQERLILPGISLHYILRKRYIRAQVEQAIAEGVTQVVNLGAGFDTLSWELHSQYPGVQFIELDHPATSAQKATVLMESCAANLHLQAVDFSQNDTGELLEQSPCFDAARRTLFICEGVMMYLQRPDIERMLAALRQSTSTSVRLLFTAVMPLESKQCNSGWLLKLYLKLKSEPLAWMIAPEQMAGFLSDAGFEQQALAGTAALKAAYLTDIPHGDLHHGEYLVVADATSTREA